MVIQVFANLHIYIGHSTGLSKDVTHVVSSVGFKQTAILLSLETTNRKVTSEQCHWFKTIGGSAFDWLRKLLNISLHE